MKQTCPPEQLIKIFWEAPMEAYFGQKTICAVRNIVRSTLDKERHKNEGPKYVKVKGAILYQKKDVVEFLESFKKG